MPLLVPVFDTWNTPVYIRCQDFIMGRRARQTDFAQEERTTKFSRHYVDNYELNSVVDRNNSLLE
jgi:hypothetical protein